jgi:regulator of nucleoside diphosphate kinase
LRDGINYFRWEINMSTQEFTPTTKRPRIVIAESEHARLMALADKAVAQDSPVGHYLTEELSRAKLVPDDNCAPDIVRMGSQVIYTDEATNKQRTVTLVYPKDADIDQNRISILTPIGAALIGLRPSQSIQWLTPGGGTSTLTVLNVDNAAVSS